VCADAHSYRIFVCLFRKLQFIFKGLQPEGHKSLESRAKMNAVDGVTLSYAEVVLNLVQVGSRFECACCKNNHGAIKPNGGVFVLMTSRSCETVLCRECWPKIDDCLSMKCYFQNDDGTNRRFSQQEMSTGVPELGIKPKQINSDFEHVAAKCTEGRNINFRDEGELQERLAKKFLDETSLESMEVFNQRHMHQGFTLQKLGAQFCMNDFLAIFNKMQYSDIFRDVFDLPTTETIEVMEGLLRDIQTRPKVWTDPAEELWMGPGQLPKITFQYTNNIGVASRFSGISMKNITDHCQSWPKINHDTNKRLRQAFDYELTELNWDYDNVEMVFYKPTDERFGLTKKFIDLRLQKSFEMGFMAKNTDKHHEIEDFFFRVDRTTWVDDGGKAKMDDVFYEGLGFIECEFKRLEATEFFEGLQRADFSNKAIEHARNLKHKVFPHDEMEKEHQRIYEGFVRTNSQEALAMDAAKHIQAVGLRGFGAGSKPRKLTKADPDWPHKTAVLRWAILKKAQGNRELKDKKMFEARADRKRKLEIEAAAQNNAEAPNQVNAPILAAQNNAEAPNQVNAPILAARNNAGIIDMVNAPRPAAQDNEWLRAAAIARENRGVRPRE
jgi:hypothetical protein